MLSFFRQLAVPIVAAAFLIVATPTRAVTVSFYTVGYFTGPASTGSGPNLVSFNYTGNTTTASGPSYFQDSTVVADGPNPLTTSFTYHNNSEYVLNLAGGLPSIPLTVNLTTGPKNANFGYFSVNSGDAASLVGLGFTLEIHQLAPPASPDFASLTATFTGSFELLESDVVLQLTPTNVAYIPDTNGVKYTVEPSDANITINRFGNSTLDGTVAVPLPGVAIGGLWLLGGLGSVGGLKTLRRRGTVLAA